MLFNGVIFGVDKDILMCSIYGSLPSTNGIELLENELTDILSKLPEVYVIITGDLNARTGEEPDYIIDDNTKYVIDSSFVYNKDDTCVER